MTKNASNSRSFSAYIAIKPDAVGWRVQSVSTKYRRKMAKVYFETTAELKSSVGIFSLYLKTKTR